MRAMFLVDLQDYLERVFIHQDEVSKKPEKFMFRY